MARSWSLERVLSRGHIAWIRKAPSKFHKSPLEFDADVEGTSQVLPFEIPTLATPG